MEEVEELQVPPSLLATLQEAQWWGVTTSTRSLTRLSCRHMEEMW